MFKNLIKKPLTLSIEGKEFDFSSVKEFEFALNGRVHVPADRFARSLALSDEELRNEARGIKNVESHFVDVISRAMDDQTVIGNHLKTMDLKLFSQDHDWRSIMTELNQAPDDFDDYKRVAMVKYIQYLSSRQDVVQAIYTDRRNRAQESHDEDDARQDSSTDSAMRETVIFDLSKGMPDAHRESLARMPKGEAIEIPWADDIKLTIVLSKHHYELRTDPEPRLLSETGDSYPLHAGKNFIGRQRDSDVCLETSHRDISRKHLIIDIDSPHDITLTDISSHGTFIAPVYMDATTQP